MEHAPAGERPLNMRAGVLFAVLLLTACAGAPTDSPSPAVPTAPAQTATPSPTLTPSATSTAVAGGWRELAQGMWLGEEVFAVAHASNEAELETLWQRLGQTDPAPSVDFARELVLFLGMSGSSSCPERLERLVVDHGAARVHGQWARHDPNTPCTDDLQAQGLLIAVERAQLPQQPFVLSLRDEPICPDCPERPDQAVVDPGP